MEVRHASEDELLIWDELVTSFTNCRISHKYAWLRSLEACGIGRALYLVFEKNREIVSCLPGLLVSIGFFRLFGSPLPGWQTVSMGPVFDPHRISTEEMMAALIPFLEKRYGVHHIELMSSELDHQTMKAFRFQGDPVFTYRTPLFPGDEDRAMKMLKDSARRNIRRAERLGLIARFEHDARFVDEHYDQIREVYLRGGNIVPFSKTRVLEYFRHMQAGGNLLAVSVYLPDGDGNEISIATGTFTVEGRELLLWMWAHRTQYRWYRPTELMTWTVMKKAMELGCDTFDLMGRGDFKTRLGATLEASQHRWIRSRYAWLTQVRSLAEKGYRWQQSLRGRMARHHLSSDKLPRCETD